MGFGRGLMALLIIGVCCILIFVILLQRGRGGGLAGAFGGAGGTSAFGAKTGDVFTWITVVLATIFLLMAVVGNFIFDASAPPGGLPIPPATVPIGVDFDGAATPAGEPPGNDVNPVTPGSPAGEPAAGASDGSESAGEEPPSP